MKTLVGIVIAVFVIFMSYVVVGGFIQKNASESGAGSSVPGSTPSNTSTTKAYTISEVAAHSSLSDCWLIIHGSVYDVTGFLAQHPGGASTITPYCGKEATQAFETQDRGSRGSHSPQATSMLAEYQIGVVN